MFKDRDLLTVLKFTAAYGVVALALMALTPTNGRTATALAGGNFEAPIEGPGSYLVLLASAE